jgi:hypothetical protein
MDASCSFRKIPISRILSLAFVLALAGCAAKAPAPNAAPAPVPIPAPPPPRPEPPGFNGLSTDALKARLGTPAFARKDGTTEMWRYDASQCHAVFFFTGGQVSHVETIPRPADQAADPACLSALNLKKKPS